MQCRPDLPAGCPRCIVQAPTICCELCTPAFFENIARVSIAKTKNRPPRTTLPAKTYQMTSQDMNLHNALHEFHKEKTIEKFGRACLRDTGPGIIMADDVLFRILDCAHFTVIETTEQLAKETRWSRVSEYGDQIVEIILHHCPKPVPPAVTPLCAADVNNLAPAAQVLPKPIAVRRCGACQLAGHISKYYKPNKADVFLTYQQNPMQTVLRNNQAGYHPAGHSTKIRSQLPLQRPQALEVYQHNLSLPTTFLIHNIQSIALPQYASPISCISVPMYLMAPWVPLSFMHNDR